MDGLSRDGYDRVLINAWLPLVPGLTERLQAGARVADVASGVLERIHTALAPTSRSTRPPAIRARACS